MTTGFHVLQDEAVSLSNTDGSVKINERRYEQLCRQWNKEKVQLGSNKWLCTTLAVIGLRTLVTPTPHVASRNRENLLIKALKPANWHWV